MGGVDFWSEAGTALRERAHAGLGPTSYRGASLQTQETFAWRPTVSSGDTATLWERYLAGARARDLVRNDPHAVAGVQRLVDMLVGAGIHVAPRPDARALGLDKKNPADREVYKQLVAALKSEFRAWAKDPRRYGDAQCKLSFNGQLRLMARTWATMGEATAVLKWKSRPGARYNTALRVIDPDRLSNPMGQPDGPLPNGRALRGGIEFDTEGAPLVYHVRNAHPADWMIQPQLALSWTEIPRATRWGRPVFVHGFEPDREDQSRAITPFAALMTRLKMIGKFADTELASATVNALFAAFVSSNLPPAEANQSFAIGQQTFATNRLDYYAGNPPTMNGVRIPILPIGDEIKVNSSPRQTTSFAVFQTAFLQSIAAALGLSYEQLAMDWSRTNYSSARAALNEVWRGIQRMFAAFTEQVIEPIRFAVIEEAFDRGYVEAPALAPGFYEAPGAYLAARYIGPARGYVDPTKEAEAATTRMGAFTSTLEREAAEQGEDWEDVLDQASVEEEELRERSLTRVVSSPGHIVPDPSDDPEAEEKEQANRLMFEELTADLAVAKADRAEALRERDAARAAAIDATIVALSKK